MSGTSPSTVWASRMSRSDLRQKRAQVPVVEERRAHQVALLQPAELLAVRAIGEHVLQVAAYGGVDQGVDRG